MASDQPPRYPGNADTQIHVANPSEVKELATDPTLKKIDPPDTHGHNTIYLDKSLVFENYHFWANRSREIEKHLHVDGIFKQITDVVRRKKDAPAQAGEVLDAGSNSSGNEKNGPGGDRFGITESEYERANRATRTATWLTIFYLITTDILGPYNVPWAIAQMGYGPGVALYIVFGIMAFYSGLQLWKQFIGLDSTRYPMRNYGDLGFRLFGNWARIGINFLQSCQFFMNVVLLIVSNGQGLQQMAAGKSGTGILCCKYCGAFVRKFLN